MRCNVSQALTELRLAPRTDRAHIFNVYVDHVFVGQYTTEKGPVVAFQTFKLPPGTVGAMVRVESVSHGWFKIHEVELFNGAITPGVCAESLDIVNVTVPAREARKKYLVDDELSDMSFWSNEGDTWFELSLDDEHKFRCLQIAPRVDREYQFNVYVNDTFVAKFTTKKTDSVALQNFTLPEGAVGSVVRVESVSHNWFKVHEVNLRGEALVFPLVGD